LGKLLNERSHGAPENFPHPLEPRSRQGDEESIKKKGPEPSEKPGVKIRLGGKKQKRGAKTNRSGSFTQLKATCGRE